MTLDIKKKKAKNKQQLQTRVLSTQKTSLQNIPHKEVLDNILEDLKIINILEWFKDFGGGMIESLTVFLGFLIIFYLVYRCTKRAIQAVMKKEVARSTFALLQKQKGGDVTRHVSTIFS